MTLIDGKKVSADVRAELKTETAAFETQYGKKVGLAVVLVGEDPASQVYVRNKIRGCEEAGIRSFAHYLPANASQSEVEELVSALAADDNVHGILVQLPLPRHLDEEKILACIPTAKDVDGFSAENIGRLAMNEEGTVACTPSGVMELLKRYEIDPRGKKPGRGAYVCPNADCLRRAVKSRALSRALETQIPDEVMERLAEALEADENGQGA